MAVHPCNPVIQKIKAGGLQIHGQSWLYSKHKASVSYIVRQRNKETTNHKPHNMKICQKGTGAIFNELLMAKTRTIWTTK
jgi:hypothetical protein